MANQAILVGKITAKGSLVGIIAKATTYSTGGADLSDDMPLMNGEASAGVAGVASRADHIHPTDSTRMPHITEMEHYPIADESKIPFMDEETLKMFYLTFKEFINHTNSASYYYNASDDVPLMNGEASSGEADKFSKADHIHPTDTTRMPADIGSLGEVRIFDNGVKFPLLDTSNALKYATWGKMRSVIAKDVNTAIETALETAVTEASYAVADLNGNYAFLPEDMEGDGILVLQTDLAHYYSKADKAQMVADVLEALPMWEGGSY